MLRIYDEHELQRHGRIRRSQAALLVAAGVLIGAWLADPERSSVALAATPTVPVFAAASCDGGRPGQLRLDCNLRLPLASR